MELPFFVVHGAIVWKVLLAGFIAGALALVACLRRWREHRATLRELAIKGELTTPLAPGHVVLRGRLVAGTASSHHGARGVTCERSRVIVVDVAGVRAAILGDVTVEHGSTVVVRRLRRVRIAAVDAGDEVLVEGTAAHGAGWELSDARILAIAPRVRARPRSIAATLAIAAIAGVIGYAGLHHLGSRALKHAEDADPDRVRTSLGNLDDVAIAAAMPGSRDAALRRLAWDLAYFERTEETFQTRLELAELLGECRAVLLLEHVRLEEALVAARACGDGALASRALLFLGRFEEAWREPDRDRTPTVDAILAIATGHWRDAAIAAEARAHEVATRVRTAHYRDADARRDALGVRCLAALFRSWAGDKAAFDSIAERATNERCTVFAALALPEHDQPAALARISLSTTRDYPLSNLRAELQRTLDPTVAWGGHSRGSLVDLVGFGIMDESVWLAGAQLALGRTDLAPARQGELLARNAAIRAFRGDLEGARALLDRSRSAYPDSYEHQANDRALRLLDPDAVMPPANDRMTSSSITDLVALRRGELPGDIDRVLHGAHGQACTLRYQEAIKAAQAGDGAALAALFRTCRMAWHATPRPMLAVLPLVKTHRTELAAALRLFTSDLTTYAPSHVPFRFLIDVAWLRDLARAIGDTERVTHWQQLFDRHASLLDDRRRLIALAMWND